MLDARKKEAVQWIEQTLEDLKRKGWVCDSEGIEISMEELEGRRSLEWELCVPTPEMPDFRGFVPALDSSRPTGLRVMIERVHDCKGVGLPKEPDESLIEMTESTRRQVGDPAADVIMTT